MKLSAERIGEVQKYRRTHSLAECAKSFGVSKGIVRRLTVDRYAGLKEYALTHTIQECATEFDVPYKVMWRMLNNKDMNYSRRYESAKFVIRAEKLAKLYRCKGSLRSVGVEVGITRQRIQQILKAAGYKYNAFKRAYEKETNNGE